MTMHDDAMTALRRTLGLKDTATGTNAEGDDTRLACWMLAMTRPWPEAAEETMQALNDAHSAGTADPTAWRRLRKAAVALSGSDDATVRALGRAAEAAAWPLATSSAGLIELMNAICEIRGKRADAATGWSAADEERATTLLDAIAKGDGTTAPSRGEIPDLFRAADPELERRFVTKLQASNLAYRGFCCEVAAWIAGATR